MTRRKTVAVTCLGLVACGLCGCGTGPKPDPAKLQASLAAYPHYQADMTALAAQTTTPTATAAWPGWGKTDTFLIRVPLNADPSASKDLARRVYARMVNIRRRDGYSALSAPQCFVHVVDPIGRDKAVDRIGKVQ